MAAESQYLNPMDPYLAPPVPYQRGVNTAQPSGRYVFKPRSAKYFTYLHEFNPLTAGAVGIRNSFQVDGDADFHILKQAVFAVDANGLRLGDTVEFEATPLSEKFTSDPMFLSHLGSGRFPTGLESPGIVLARNTVFTATVSSRNLGGLNTTIFIAHFGMKVYKQPLVMPRVYHEQKRGYYVANFTANDGGVGTIPAASTSIFTIRTDGGSDFDVRKITVTADAPVTIQIQSDEDNWYQRAIRGELLNATGIETPGISSGELPHILTVPRLISGAGYINVQVTNLDVVNAIRCQVVFHGPKLYPAGGGGR